MWEKTLKVNGYDFLFTAHDHEQHGIVVPLDAPLDDPDYVAALQYAMTLWESLHDYVRLDNRRYYWYKADESSRRYADRAEMMDIAWRFTTQKQLTVPDWIHKLLQDLRDNIPEVIQEPKYKYTRKQRKGFVYLIKQVGGESYKIGYTADPSNRAKTFGIQLPFDVEYICLIPTDDMTMLEAELHKKFEERRTIGEWFALTPDDITYLMGLAP